MNEYQQIIFSPLSIRNIVIPNRLLRSATWEGLADADGSPTPELLDFYEELFSKSPGLSISGHCFVEPAGRAGKRQLGLWRKNQLAQFSQLVAIAQKHKAQFFLQLAHAGGWAEGGIIPSNGTEHFKNRDDLHEASTQEVQQLIEKFVTSAQLADQAGFAGIQLHAAHGYGLSQFLSPAFNKRDDEFGGTQEKRGKIILHIIKEIRRQTSLTIGVKINCHDFLPDGLKPDMIIKNLIQFEKAGLDFIEISGGTLVSGANGPIRKNILAGQNEAYFADNAVDIIKEIKVPAFITGGIRSPKCAAEMIKNRNFAGVGLSRPFIRQPHLVENWQNEKPQPASCISCNKCFIPLRNNRGAICFLDNPEKPQTT